MKSVCEDPGHVASVENATQVALMWPLLHVMIVETRQISLKLIDLNANHIKGTSISQLNFINLPLSFWPWPGVV